MNKNFEIDKQTLDDLNIPGKYKSNSIYSLFCDTVTHGGELLLEQMFNHPLTDAKEINSRSAIFKCFCDYPSTFPENREEFETMEQYLTSSDGNGHWISSLFRLCKLKAMKLLSNDPRLHIWQDQVSVTLSFLKKALMYLETLPEVVKGTSLEERVSHGLAVLQNEQMHQLLSVNTDEEMNLKDLFLLNKALSYSFNASLQNLLELFYELDVAIVVGRVAKERGLCFATAHADHEVSVGICGLFHPHISGAVSNDLEITKHKNIFFLTGANMAGKSTLMKSFGVAVYMAHMGFPIAAKSMQFAVQDGMYTSINVPDNINMGYSHFYAEVLRVKKVAIEVSLSKRLIVIFDELFKGTNVKDAYDATLAVTTALSKRHACSFMISTHIIEVGQDLAKSCDNVSFSYLPTIMKDKVPTYTYRLKTGITNDKHGMIIIENEHIIDIIRRRKQSKRDKVSIT